jgi:hypothetical protein
LFATGVPPHGQAVLLAQAHLLFTQTQNPCFMPLESMYIPPATPPMSLQTVHESATVQAAEPIGTPVGHAAFAAVGIL